jgi:hypothetical protein
VEEMSKLNFIGLDGEMTGSGSRERGVVASKKYQLIQIGLAANPNNIQTFCSDIGYREWNSQPEAMEVNKFTPERILAGPAPDYVDSEACRWLDKQVGKGRRDLHAVGWNVGGFDMPFVAEYLPKLFDRFSYRCVDLNSIVFAMSDDENDYKRIKGKVKSGAEVLLKKRGIQSDWHNAGYDAVNALLAFELLREEESSFDYNRIVHDL